MAAYPQATALIVGLLPVLIDRWYLTLDKGGSSLYTAVTVGAAGVAIAAGGVGTGAHGGCCRTWLLLLGLPLPRLPLRNASPAVATRASPAATFVEVVLGLGPFALCARVVHDYTLSAICHLPRWLWCWSRPPAMPSERLQSGCWARGWRAAWACLSCSSVSPFAQFRPAGWVMPMG